MKYFTNIDGVNIYIDPGVISVEPGLMFEADDGDIVRFTIDESGHKLGKFTLNKRILKDYNDTKKIVNGLSRQIEHSIDKDFFILKDKYYKILIDEIDKFDSK